MSKTVVVTFVFVALLVGPVSIAAGDTADALTEDQMLWGLMQVWAEVKFNFVYFDQVPELDWDAAVQAAIPKVLTSRDRTEYYQVLRELVAKLDDGHTMVLPPETFSGENDNPPVELQLVEGKAIVSRVGENDETTAAGLRPGLELVAIGDGEGIPVWQYFAEHVARYFQGGSEQWTRTAGLFFMLNGPKGSSVRLHLREPQGGLKQVELKRDSRLTDGSTFVHWMLGHQKPLEHRLIGEGIAYFKLPSFGSEQLVADFNEILDRLDPARLRGMILDIRVNNGGNSRNAFAIIARLIDREIATYCWRTRQYLPAHRSWGQDEQWFESEPRMTSPSEAGTYSGPLVVLIGPGTVSAAEDFVAPLDHAERAILIGTTTAGTTGNPIRVPLPGGGLLMVCAIRSTYPDGREFVGSGIEPDYLVAPTQQDIWDNRDRALDKAMEVLSTWE